MHAVYLHGPRDLRLTEVPEIDRSPSLGEALIRVGAVGICGSDLHLYQTGQIGSIGEGAAPFVPGHEFMGTVVAVGLSGRHLRKEHSFHPSSHGLDQGFKTRLLASDRHVFFPCEDGRIYRVDRSPEGPPTETLVHYETSVGEVKHHIRERGGAASRAREASSIRMASTRPARSNSRALPSAQLTSSAVADRARIISGLPLTGGTQSTCSLRDHRLFDRRG